MFIRAEPSLRLVNWQDSWIHYPFVCIHCVSDQHRKTSWRVDEYCKIVPTTNIPESPEL